MTQQMPPSPEYHDVFSPTTAQKQRAEALKRFNRLYVFTPIIAVSVIAVLIIALMIIATLAPGLEGYSTFISALADITIIMFITPVIIVMLSGPLLLFALINNSRNRRKLGKPAFDQGGGFQVLLWKLDLLLQNSQQKTREIAPQMANQVIRINESLAYTGAFIKQLASYFKRS